ncbi:type VI secretion system tube protein TssD [Tenacibaculum ovolyticum]
MKEVEFKNAYIVYYKETLNVNGDVPMTINFTVSAEEMTIGNAAIDNRWPVA